MTKEEQTEIAIDLHEMFNDNMTWETAAEEIDLDDGSEEYAYGKLLWDKWESDRNLPKG
jgi:hypothetical protein